MVRNRRFLGRILSRVVAFTTGLPKILAGRLMASYLPVPALAHSPPLLTLNSPLSQRVPHHHKTPGVRHPLTPCRSFANITEGAALRSFVCKEGQLRGVGQVAFAHAWRVNELGNFAVAERDRRGGLITKSKVGRAGG